MHSLDIRSVNLIYLVHSYPLFPYLFQLCLSTLYISSIKLWSSTLCPFNVKLWFHKNLQWSKTWNLLATTRNSLHHYWVQPYWLESTEDPKISPIVPIDHRQNYLVTTTLIWGSNWKIEMSAHQVSPFVIVTARIVVSSLRRSLKEDMISIF